jgi:hypothetical protein
MYLYYWLKGNKQVRKQQKFYSLSKRYKQIRRLALRRRELVWEVGESTRVFVQVNMLKQSNKQVIKSSLQLLQRINYGLHCEEKPLHVVI